jgi:hypothetical protein
LKFYNSDRELKTLAEQAIANIDREFTDLSSDQIAVTWLVYDQPIPVNTGGAITADELWQYPIRGFGHRSRERIYPASISKLFYAVAIQEWLERGMVAPERELDRALRDAVVDSSNDATSLIVDYLSGTTSGPELPPDPFKTWSHQRNIVNRYFQSLGWSELEPININQKTWSESPYGRERAFVGEMRENRNMLTTDAVARLLHAIVGGIAVSRDRSLLLMDLLHRNLKSAAPVPGEENQIHGFLGEGISADSQIWSKAGWTSQVRHDAAYIEPPDRSPYLLVIFTEGRASQNRHLLPYISQQFAAAQAQIETSD